MTETGTTAITLASLLETYGLDPSKWEPKFKEKLGVTNTAAIAFTKASDVKKFDRQDFKYDWEKTALTKLLSSADRRAASGATEAAEKAAEAKKNAKALAIEASTERVKTMLEDLKKTGADSKTTRDELMKKISDALASPDLMPDNTRDSVSSQYEKLSVENETGGVGLHRKSLDDNDLLAYASGGIALQGIFPVEDKEHMVPTRDRLIDVFHFTLRGPQQQAFSHQISFSSTEDEQSYTTTMNKHGCHMAASASVSWGLASVSAGFSKDDEEESKNSNQSQSSQTYQSTVKHCSVPMATCYIERNMIKLSAEAMEALMKIGTSREKCSEFFRKFGSHANQGPLVLGGRYTWKTSLKGFQKAERFTAMSMTTSTLEAHVSASYAGNTVGASGGTEDAHGTDTSSRKSALASTMELTITKVGGAPEVDGIHAWQNSLADSNSTWSVIQTGETLIPVWELLSSHDDNNENKDPKVAELCKLLQEEYENLEKKRTTPDVPTPPKPGNPTIAFKSEDNRDAVQAICFLNDLFMVIRCKVDEVYFYNAKSFKMQRQLKFEGLSCNLTGLATCAMSSHLYIADGENRCIHRVNLPDANFQIKWAVDPRPIDVSVNSSHNVLVVCESSKGREYSPDGTLVREISFDHNVRFAKELSSGLLAVSHADRENIGVSIFEMKTQVVLKTYITDSNVLDGRWHAECNLTVDKDGYILVADFSQGRVLVLNPTLTAACQLPLPTGIALFEPYALTLDQSRNRLYVGELGNQRRLLVFDNVTNFGALFNVSDVDVHC